MNKQQAAALIEKIETTLGYFRDEFPDDQYPEVWDEAISSYANGVTPNDLLEIKSALQSVIDAGEKPLSGQPAPDLEELKSALSTPVTGTNFLTQEDARRMFIIFDAAKAYLDMRSAQGMVMVPVEPTDEMYHAGYERINESLETGTIATCGDVYKAMIAARPKGE